MLKPCLAWFFAVASAQDTGFMRTVFVEYVDGTSDGHFQFGKAIGEAMGPDIQTVWAGDLELHAMEIWAPRPDAAREVVFNHERTRKKGQTWN